MATALTIGACAPPQTGGGPTTAPPTKGLITAVVDGDTIEVGTVNESLTIRLAATNAPEEGECYADEAREHLMQEVGSVATIEVVGADQYERTLAHVFVGGRHINLEMVTMGLAMAYTTGAEDVYGEALAGAEQNAYVAELGLWNAAACGASGPPAAVAIDAERSSPDPPGPDNENLEAEKITLVNRGGVDVDLSRWILRDESSRNRYTFPDGVVLDPGGRLVITSADSGWSPGGGAVWNNDGDMVLLQDGLGTVVDRWRY